MGVKIMKTYNSRYITHSKKVEEEMIKKNNELEEKIEDKIKKLEEVNAMLEKEIAEGKRTMEDLKVNEERLTFALEGSGDGVWDWNAITNEVIYSKEWKGMLGYEESEIAKFI